ncbi:CLUMA_CG009419, isoform A [Clunio marinus]|uniref:CLUMA_CG009419, isoform A n=1 Tax=Clunio marinus TaxID=568069 RepID=A0A1J1I8B7_9DIPT|nr:CLUMA_CG009419, isoform A [Clunio marinus]
MSQLKVDDTQQLSVILQFMLAFIIKVEIKEDCFKRGPCAKWQKLLFDAYSKQQAAFVSLTPINVLLFINNNQVSIINYSNYLKIPSAPEELKHLHLIVFQINKKLREEKKISLLTKLFGEISSDRLQTLS